MVEVEVISTEELGDRSYIAHTDTHLSYVVDDGHGPWRCSPAGRCCIGIDRPAGAATGRPADLAPGENLRGYPAVAFADLAARSGAEAGEPVLDVRRNDERATGGIPWATHIPMQDLLERLDELPAGRLWIHCAAGYRAGIAAGLLDRAGRDVVLVDDDDNRAVELGLAPSWHHRSWPEASTGTPATTAPFSATTSRTMRCTRYSMSVVNCSRVGVPAIAQTAIPAIRLPGPRPWSTAHTAGRATAVTTGGSTRG